MASTWLIEWRIFSSCSLSLVFGRAIGLPSCGVAGVAAFLPELALLGVALLVEAAAGTGIRRW
jgi:hypothetical protein